MPHCTADATWSGSLLEGAGQLELGSEVWADAYGTPHADGVTNPEELLAASHASCFAMTLAYILGESGFTPEDVHATSNVVVEQGEASISIPSIEVAVDASVPDATETGFREAANQAEAFCPVSQALAGTEITVETLRRS